MLVEAQHVRQVLQTASADFQGALTSLSSQREHPEHVATVLQLLSSGLVPQAWVPDGMTGQSSGLLQSGEAPTLLAWRTTIQSRLEFLRGYKSLPGGQPAVWDLSLLAYPGAVLGALRCSFAAENAISTHAVTFRTVVMKPTVEAALPASPPSLGIHVGGLLLQVCLWPAWQPSLSCFPMSPDALSSSPWTGLGFATWRSGPQIRVVGLQGADWDAEKGLLLELGEGKLFTPLPVVWLVPTHHGALQTPAQQRASQMLYECPLFRAPGDVAVPDSELISLRLETRRGPEQWVRAGLVAVLSMSRCRRAL